MRFLSNTLYADLVPLRALALPLYFPCLLFGFALGAVILILPLFAHELGASVAAAGLVLGVKGAGRFLTNIPSGLLVSRLGEKPSMMLATAVLILTSFVAARVDSIVDLFLCSAVLGCAVSLWFLARVKYVVDHVPREILGRAMVALSFVEKMGMLLGPLLAGYVMKNLGYGTAFLIPTAAGLIVLTLVHLFAKQQFKDSPGSASHNFQRILEIVSGQLNQFLTIGAVIVVLLLLRTAKYTILPLWAVSIDINPAQIGTIIFAAGCVELLMFGPAALILDLRGRKWAASLSLLVFSLAFAVLAFATEHQSLLAAALIMGLADGFSTGWGNTVISDLSPKKNRAEYLAVWRTIGDIGNLSGPMMVGILASLFALPGAAGVIAATSLLGLTLLIISVPETRPR